MDWVNALLAGIPYVVGAIAPGFLVMASFCWATSNNISDGKTVIVISATITYLIDNVCQLFNIPNTHIATIGVCACSALLGIIAAIVYKLSFVNKLIANIGIKRTTNKSIWDDALGEAAWVALLDSDNKCYYCGQFLYQNYENENSYIVIATYYIADLGGKILEGKDYTQDMDRKLLLNADDFDQIIISKSDPFNNREDS